MTTKEGEASPGERTTEPSAPAVAAGDGQEAAPLSGKIAAPPDDARQLELEIQRTREQLGETVQELLARADVKGRALAKATEVSQKCKSTVVQARSRAATRVAGVRSQAGSAGKAGKDQLRGQVAAVGAPAWEAMPEQVRRALTKGVSGARQHWVPLAVAAGVAVIGYLAIRHGRQVPRAEQT